MEDVIICKENIYNILKKIFLTFAIIVTLMAIGNAKVGYHVDEMYTFGLSNHQYRNSIAPDIRDGAVYTGKQLWQEYVVVNKSHRFDYHNVFVNQEHDVHPPLYYSLIHTVFSFFPGIFKRWFSLIVNVLLAAVIFWQMAWLFEYFTGDNKKSILFALLFLFTMGFVNNVVFFRMYVLLTAWTNALAILFLKYKPTEGHWEYYIFLAAIMLGGTLTQYYFIVYSFFACALYAVCVILAKSWKKFLLSVISIGISFGISTLIYPVMWHHIFHSYRGREAFAFDISKLWEAVLQYFNILNLQLFGEWVILLIFLIILLGINWWRKNSEHHIDHETVRRYLQILLPVVCYVVIIALISPYKADRYVFNVMGLLYLSAFECLINLTKLLSKRETICVLLVAPILLFCSYQKGIPYLFRGEKAKISDVRALGNNIPCLYLYQDSWRILPNYSEMAGLNKIIFIRINNLKMLNEARFHKYSKLLVYVSQKIDKENVINQIIKDNPNLNKSKELFDSGYETAYYLSK